MTTLKEKLKDLPKKPGVYLFKDKSGNVLYVGKAKNLKNRVLQYFGTDLRPQIPFLLEEAVDVDYTVVGSELEALFLENTLIKQYLPPYNIKLRDDKNYAFIKIDYSTEIPQIGYARKIENAPELSFRAKSRAYRETKARNLDSSPSRARIQNDKQNKKLEPNSLKLGAKASYFGPYSSALKIKRTLDTVRKVFPYCANKEQGKRPCFYYYLHRCPGICVGVVTMDEYLLQLKRIENFLKGDTKSVKKELAQEMQKASRKKQFERAGKLRDQLKALELLDEKQTMMFAKNVSWDFVSLYQEYGQSCINLFKVRGGRLMDKENFIYNNANIPTSPANEQMHANETNKTLEKIDAEVLDTFLENYYQDTSDVPAEIYTQFKPTNQQLIQKLLYSKVKKKVSITFPTRGEKLKLTNLGKANAEEFLKKWQANSAINKDLLNNTLAELQSLLNLPTLPKRIECYDISNIQGTNSVSSMVVFKDGLPAKSEYRKFKIKLITKDGGPDDFAMMAETITRRLNHLPNPNLLIQSESTNEANIKSTIKDKGSKIVLWPRPDLIIVDGGKGQLNAALDAQTEFLKAKSSKLEAIPMVGLAKRIEEIFLPGKKQPLILDHAHPALQLLQRLRDEAHRFAITFHRSRRSKAAIKSRLDELSGIGPKTKKLLKQKFGSISSIKKVDFEELKKLVGRKKAEIIKKEL